MKIKEQPRIAVRRVIPYIKELRPIAGSVTATILWQQLNYWFALYPKGFYKFLEPCKHAAYKEGDSWTEELGFSKAEFRHAFKLIGIAYKSKREYNRAANPFFSDGKESFFCSYHDKIKGITWYFRNHEYVNKIMDRLIIQDDNSVNQESESTEIKKVDLRKSTNLIYGNQESESTEIKKVDPDNNTESINRDDTEKTTTTTAPEIFSKTEENLSAEKNRAVGKEIGRGDNNEQVPPQERVESEKTNATTEPRTVESECGTDSGVNLIFDFALKDFTPEQRQRAQDMLKPIPEGDRQSVLDEFNNALSKNNVRSPWAYFSTLVRQYTAGVFVPTSDFTGSRENTEREAKKIAAKTAAQKPEAIKACHYCTDEGDLCFNINGGKSTVWCDHDAEHIMRYAKEKNAVIESAKSGYQNPEQPTMPPMAQQADLDRHDILNPAPDFSAPSPRQPFQICSDEEAAALDEVAAYPADNLDPDTAARFDEIMNQLTARLAMPH